MTEPSLTNQASSAILDVAAVETAARMTSDMGWVLAAAGVALIVAALIDFIWTVLTVRGDAPMTGWIPIAVWRGINVVARVIDISHARAAAGPLAVLAVFLVWITLVWLGWSLIFLAHPGAVVDPQTGRNADWWDTVYYVGFTITTLGVGDLEAGGPYWRLLTAFAALMGLSLVTLAITYLLSVVSAVTQGRALAASLHSHGLRPEELLVAGWNGRDLSKLEQWLDGSAPALSAYSQKQLAYPIIDFFWTGRREYAVPPAVAALHEALSLGTFGIQPRARLAAFHTDPVRRAIDTILRTLLSTHEVSVGEPPPPPELAVLRRAGVTVVDDAAFLTALDGRQRQRCVLAGWCRTHGWEWHPPSDGQRAAQ